MLAEADANLIVLKYSFIEYNFIECCAWLQSTVLMIACPTQAGHWKILPSFKRSNRFFRWLSGQWSSFYTVSLHAWNLYWSRWKAYTNLSLSEHPLKLLRNLPPKSRCDLSELWIFIFSFFPFFKFTDQCFNFLENLDWRAFCPSCRPWIWHKTFKIWRL